MKTNNLLTFRPSKAKLGSLVKLKVINYLIQENSERMKFLIRSLDNDIQKLYNCFKNFKV